jgi:prevent-host-death family protein
MPMPTYNIHDAKTQLSKLVEMAAKGESFIIAKAGRPMVRVTALDTPEASQTKRFGFMAGQIKVPDDFNTMGADQIQKLFEGKA